MDQQETEVARAEDSGRGHALKARELELEVLALQSAVSFFHEDADREEAFAHEQQTRKRAEAQCMLLDTRCSALENRCEQAEVELWNSLIHNAKLMNNQNTITKLESSQSELDTNTCLDTTRNQLDVTRMRLEAQAHLNSMRAHLETTQLPTTGDPPATINSAVALDIVLSLQSTVLDLQSKLTQAHATILAHERMITTHEATIAALRSQLSVFHSMHERVTEQLADAHLAVSHPREKPQALQFGAPSGSPSSPPVTGSSAAPPRFRVSITLPRRNPLHRQLYGYYVSLDWIRETIHQLYPTYKGDNLQMPHIIGRLMGIRRLTLLYGLRPRDISIPENCTHEGAVIVLTICTDEEHSLCDRPTQERIDALTELVGQEPRWWTAFNTRY
ncbi:hypothetical protein BJ138DRAFT_1161794 [Hygrophoropsis aurantiaca]|uniref:Uncharacterized protein n=1 Tax=Hygrophoropsis aurantiaca TaxID=72124 RepID=A0ACB8A267_9AGAM|nr:hypothetical protein BJ138DRAFT_1161794 [Hygrophoropsis aurantiaca]